MRPSKEALAAINEELAKAMESLADVALAHDSEAWATLVNYVSFSQRVLMKTNPSKIVDAARTTWIAVLMPREEPKP